MIYITKIMELNDILAEQLPRELCEKVRKYVFNDRVANLEKLFEKVFDMWTYFKESSMMWDENIKVAHKEQVSCCLTGEVPHIIFEIGIDGRMRHKYGSYDVGRWKCFTAMRSVIFCPYLIGGMPYWIKNKSLHTRGEQISHGMRKISSEIKSIEDKLESNTLKMESIARISSKIYTDLDHIQKLLRYHVDHEV